MSFMLTCIILLSTSGWDIFVLCFVCNVFLAAGRQRVWVFLTPVSNYGVSDDYCCQQLMGSMWRGVASHCIFPWQQQPRLQQAQLLARAFGVAPGSRNLYPDQGQPTELLWRAQGIMVSLATGTRAEQSGEWVLDWTASGPRTTSCLAWSVVTVKNSWRSLSFCLISASRQKMLFFKTEKVRWQDLSYHFSNR